MPTAYTNLLGLALPVTGELQGTWGDTVNNFITNYLDASIAGTQTLSTDADVTLTKTTNAVLGATSSQYLILNCTGARAAARNITVPAQSKAYIVINATSGGFAVTLRGAGPTTGVSIAAGEFAVCAWNGSDFVKISSLGGPGTFTNLTVSGTTTLSALTASTALALNGSKEVVSVTNTGTGNNVLATSPTLTTPNLGTPSALTLTNATGLPLSTGVTGTLATTNGGTGLTSFTANGVVYASSTSALATGSALTFDGTLLGATAASSGAVLELLRLNNSGTGGGTQSQLTFYAASTNYAQITGGFSGAPSLISNVSAAGYQQWQIGAAEQMRLTSTGLGIGTSSPLNKLVVSNAGANGFEFDPANGIMQTYNRSTAAYTATNLLALQINFKTGSSPATTMTLDASGNLGLGVTPQAWSTPAFEVIGGLAISSVSGADYTLNAYYNAGWLYRSNGTATRYEQNTSQHRWFTAPSGTAGNAISFTQALTLSSNSPFLTGTNLDAGSNALAIGMTGAQNLAFFTNNTERARITSGGDLLVGTTDTGAAGLGVSNLLNLTFPEGSGTSYANVFRQASSAATVIANGYKRSATASGFASSVGTSWAKTAIGLGVSTGAITFYADSAATVANGTDVTPTERARITSGGQLVLNSGATGNQLQFWDTGAVAERARLGINASNGLDFAVGSTTPRMTITSTGNVVAGGSVALATNATNGFLYVPTCAGTPTGTPTAITGMAPIVVDTTNNKLYFYSGGQWRDAGP